MKNSIVVVAVLVVGLVSLSLAETQTSQRNNVRLRKTIVNDNTKEKESDDDSGRAAYYYQLDPSVYTKQQQLQLQLQPQHASSLLLSQHYPQQYDVGNHQQYLQQHLQQMQGQVHTQLQHPTATKVLYQPQTIYKPSIAHYLEQSKTAAATHVQKPHIYSPASEVSSFKYESPLVSYTNNGLISQLISPKHQREHNQHEQNLQAVLQQQNHQADLKLIQHQAQPEIHPQLNHQQLLVYPQHPHQQQQQQAVYYMVNGAKTGNSNGRTTLLAVPSGLLHSKHGEGHSLGQQMFYLVQRPQHVHEHKE